MKCNEAPEEPPTVSEERLLQLSCFINQGKFHWKKPKKNFLFSRCEIFINWFKKCMFIFKYKNPLISFVLLEIRRTNNKTFIDTWS